jgi:hypothetical protein
MRSWIGVVVFAVFLGVCSSPVVGADPICVDPSNCGGPTGCTSDDDCTVPGQRCIVGFDPDPPYLPVNICCAACPGSPTPFAACGSTFSDCDGCAFGCVDPVDEGAAVPALSAWGSLPLVALLMLSMGWAVRRRRVRRFAA